jgi:hypothetical protein
MKHATRSITQGLGDCASRTVATHEPSPVARSRPLRVSVNYRDGRAIVRPTFVCRTLKEPRPFGHRQWLKLEGR